MYDLASNLEEIAVTADADAAQLSLNIQRCGPKWTEQVRREYAASAAAAREMASGLRKPCITAEQAIELIAACSRKAYRGPAR